MKKILTLLTVILLGFSLNKASAQADVALSVTLTSAQSIVIAQPTVSITFDQPGDYLSGKSSGVQANHIKISSTGLFTVSVKSSGDITNGNVANDIPISALSLTPTFEASTTTLLTPTFPLGSSPVSASDQAFIKASSGTNEAVYSVDYNIAAGINGVNVLNRPTGTTPYTATITYTIAPN